MISSKPKQLCIASRQWEGVARPESEVVLAPKIKEEPRPTRNSGQIKPLKILSESRRSLKRQRERERKEKGSEWNERKGKAIKEKERGEENGGGN